MKILERLALVLFSIIMTVIAVMSCLVVFNLVELESIYRFIAELIKDETASKVIIASSVVAILLSIKALFFPSKINKKQEMKTGVLLENKDGRLLISKDTIENLVNSIVKSFCEAMDVQTKINLDAENNITVYISLLVRADAVISELSSNIQNKIKDTIKRNIGLEVDQVNINIRDIESVKSESKNGGLTKVNVNSIKINDKKVNEDKLKKSTDGEKVSEAKVEESKLDVSVVD